VSSRGHVASSVEGKGTTQKPIGEVAPYC